MPLSDVEKALAAAKGLTKATGALHEAQLFQLKCWGAAAFHGSGWRADVDTDGCVVTYHVAFLPKTSRKQTKTWWKKMFEGLNRSLHWLLGDNWQLRVVVADNLVFEGEFTKPSANEQRADRVNRGED